MSANVEYQPGPFAKIFAWVGFFSGAAAFSETDNGIAILIGAVVMATIGAIVGRMADAAMAWLVFVVVAVIEFMINSAIRQFILGLLS